MANKTAFLETYNIQYAIKSTYLKFFLDLHFLYNKNIILIRAILTIRKKRCSL